MKYTIKAIIYSLLVSSVISAKVHATEVKPSTLLYISPNDYNYSVRLLHPYYNYWFEQGPLIAPIALEALKSTFGDIKQCKANETADTIIKIKPHIFYNPQLRVYHSKLVATVYSGAGNLLGSYVGEAQQQGFSSIDVGTKLHLTKAYALAMQQLMTKLQLNHLPDDVKPGIELPCGMIGAQNEVRINFY